MATEVTTAAPLNILDEGPLSLTGAAKAVPAIDGKHPNPSTLWRWCRVGVRGVRLEYARLGDRIVTSRPALTRFSVALASADQATLTRSRPAPTPTARTLAQRKRAIQEAEAELAKAGI